MAQRAMAHGTSLWDAVRAARAREEAAERERRLQRKKKQEEDDAAAATGEFTVFFFLNSPSLFSALVLTVNAHDISFLVHSQREPRSPKSKRSERDCRNELEQRREQASMRTKKMSPLLILLLHQPRPRR